MSGAPTPPRTGAPHGAPPPYGAPPYGAPPPPNWAPPPYGAPPYGHPGYAPPVIFFDPVLGVPLAHWWKRLVAWIVDGAVIGAAFYVLYFVVLIPTFFASVLTASRRATNTGVPVGLVVGLVIFGALAVVLPVLYLAIGDGTMRGQTLGKLAMGIAVRDARGNSVIGFWRGLGRTSFNVLLAVMFELPLVIGNLAPLWDHRRQSWADHVARSVVVDLRP